MPDAPPDAMASAPTARSRGRTAAAEFVRLGAGSFLLVLLLRLYERLALALAHSAAGIASPWWRALQGDVAFTLQLAALLAVPVMAVGLRSPGAARLVHRAALVVVALVSVALAQYFAVTLVPLGADLLGYSWSDIRETTLASRGISPGSVIPLVLAAVAAWFVPLATRRLRVTRVVGAGFGAAVVMSVVLPSWITPSPGTFSSDTAYYLAANKADWFASRIVGHVADTWRRAPADVTLAGYPLMHRVAYEDVLGPRLSLAAQPPNIVIVVVEGLGRDFTGPGAEYGGFTPFLDSLADHSLSWDNFVSTSGRTFGVFPSLLGSLPFGASGFMELGVRMPAHQTLLSLLKTQGYATNYFTGTNGHYDNIDVFMERQGVGRFVDQSGFGPGFALQPGSNGVSWGYPDDALFRRSLELIGPPSRTPRLDVYLTITTHEPFIPPRAAEYRAEFERRLSTLAPPENKRNTYREFAGIFETLLYTDGALRGFFAAYAARADFGRTIFIVTGDHRLIPLPPSSRIARYHVPFIIASPMLKAPHHFASVSSHLDVTPSLLALLQRAYGLTVPDSAAWLGAGLDTATAFRHTQSLALMRTKNALDEYLDGTMFSSGGQLFRLDKAFDLSAANDGAARDAAAEKLDRFRAINRFVTTGEHLVPPSAGAPAYDAAAAAREDSAYRALNLESAVPEQAFEVARQAAARNDYTTVRLVTRRLLRDAPSYHDARALLGRSYGWERNFTEARTILEGLVRRAPDYADGYAALIDLDIWQGQGVQALTGATSALKRFPGAPALLYRKARALELRNRRDEAIATLDVLRRVQPVDAEADALRTRLLVRTP